MLEKLLQKISSTLYVQIWESRIRVSLLGSEQVFDEKPHVAIRTVGGKQIVDAVGNNAVVAGVEDGVEVVNPFSHPRQLLSDFQVGTKLLQYAIQTVLGGKLFSPSPLIIMHPMEKDEGGYSEIEVRAFRELALSAGGREVIFYHGPELSLEEIDFKALKELDSQYSE